MEGKVIEEKEKVDEGKEKETQQHEGDGDSAKAVAIPEAGGSEDSKNFFMKIIKRKTNIYSTKAVALKSPWSFWIDRTHNGMKVEEFTRNLHHIFTVYSVHEFWRVLCNIPLPSALHTHSSMHFTREARRPIWEESYNSKGGTFRFRIPKRDTDKVWRELLMATASEHWFDFIEEADDVCGVSVSVRDREDLIMIWNTNASLSKVARMFECTRLLLPDVFFNGEFYKPHTNHHAFEKQLAAAAASSDEGIMGVFRRGNEGGGHGHGSKRHGGGRGPGSRGTVY